MAVQKLADLLAWREERRATNSNVGAASPMSSGTWGTRTLGSDPRMPSASRNTGFVFGSSVWGVDSFGTRESTLAGTYGITPEED